MTAELLMLVVVAVMAVFVREHSCLVGSCLSVEPLSQFDMNKFLGKWYVIQKTKKEERCLQYNFTESSKPYEYDLNRVSEGMKKYCTNHLTVSSPNTPAKMAVQFKRIKNATYTVFATDYDSYAVLFFCKEMPDGRHSQSATILSRRETLDKTYLDIVMEKLQSLGAKLNSWNVIDHTNCGGGANNAKETTEEDEKIHSYNFSLLLKNLHNSPQNSTPPQKLHPFH